MFLDGTVGGKLRDAETLCTREVRIFSLWGQSSCIWYKVFLFLVRRVFRSLSYSSLGGFFFLLLWGPELDDEVARAFHAGCCCGGGVERFICEFPFWARLFFGREMA